MNAAGDPLVRDEIEHELKFALSPTMRAEFDDRAVAGLAGAPRRVRSTYYDTSAGDLMNAGVALRVRSVDGGFRQTVKAVDASDPSDPFSRYEWERPVPADRPSLDALPPSEHPAGALLRDCFAMLIPVFETDFERRVRIVVPQDDARLELACDVGTVRAGTAGETISEVEIERKRGSAAAFYQYALQWARLHDARLLLQTKHARGLRLAGWVTDAVEPARRRSFSPDAGLPVATAARRILLGHLNHFLANLDPVRDGEHVEGPHQLRVALRRLRSAVRFFGLREDPLREADTPWRTLDRMAKHIADGAGFVRDADVFESGLLKSLRRHFPRDAALQVLARAIDVERGAARTRLRERLAEGSTSEFVLLALAAIETLDRHDFGDPDYGRFATRRIGALARRVRRFAGAAKDEDGWHDVRIAIKNLRYALESCDGIAVATEPTGRVVSRLAAWQAALGESQDLAVARGTAGQALAATQAATETSVRCIALIDGYRVFVLSRSRTDRIRRRIRDDLKTWFDGPRSGEGPAAGPPRADGSADLPADPADAPAPRRPVAAEADAKPRPPTGGDGPDATSAQAIATAGAKSASKGGSKRTAKAAPKAAPKSAPKSAAKSAPGQASKPTSKSPAKPSSHPASEPASKRGAEALATSPPGIAAEAVVGADLQPGARTDATHARKAVQKAARKLSRKTGPSRDRTAGIGRSGTDLDLPDPTI